MVHSGTISHTMKGNSPEFPGIIEISPEISVIYINSQPILHQIYANQAQIHVHIHEIVQISWNKKRILEEKERNSRYLRDICPEKQREFYRILGNSPENSR